MDNYEINPNVSQFDTGLNDQYHTQLDQQSSVVADLTGGAVAAVADFGASVWNSMPGTDYVDTGDILSRVSNNALRVYDEHPDAVHAASFIGGMFLPTGLALKGMGALRAGVKGASWFSNAGRAESLAKIDKLFLEGAAATSEYRAAKMAFYGRGLANQVTDAAAMEFALVGSMSAHPLMEDYMKDPVKNFGISLAIGGVIGGTIGHIVDRFALGKLEHAGESAIVQDLTKDLTTVHPAEQYANQIVAHEANIETLQKIIQNKGAVVANSTEGLAVEVANKYLLSTKAAQNEAFESMLAPEVLASVKANPDVRDTMMKMVVEGGFTGASEVGYLTQKLDGAGNVMNIEAGKDGFLSKLVFGKKKQTFVDADTGVETVKESLIDVAYSPEFGRFYDIKQVKHYGRARDLGISAESMAKNTGDFRLPNTDIAEEMLSKNAASIDAHWLGTLKAVDEMSVAQVKNIVLSGDDLPLRNALLARINKEPEAFSNHTWKVTDNKPNFEAFTTEVIKSQAANGVKATHLGDLKAFTTPAEMADKYDLHTISKVRGEKDVHQVLDDWINGNKKPMQQAMEEARLNSERAGVESLVGTKIYNAPESIALRKQFAANADADGYVYLYRGLHKGKAVGHGLLDSYTTDISKASEFGTPQLYKVNVDDIVTGVIDKLGYRKNEIIVRAGTLESHASPATIPVAGSSQGKAVVTKISTGVTEHDAIGLSNQLIQGKDSTISSMLEQGLPMETIAIRTNTPLDTIKTFSLSPEGTSIIDIDNAFGHAEYNAASKIPEYLDTTKRTLRVKSDIAKQKYSEVKANLDGNSKFNMHNEITSAVLAQSESAFARELGSYYFSPERQPLLGMLRGKLSEFVNGGAGNRFLTSSDHFTRNMGDVGMIVNTMGKDIVKKTNNAIDTVLQPLNFNYARINKDAVALAEYNTAVNVNASIKGWRTFQDGQFWTRVASKDLEGNTVMTLEPVLYQGKEFKVVSESVLDTFESHQRAGRELYAMKNTINKVLGKPDMSDIGLWLPAFNPKDKFIAYVHNKTDDTTRLLWGNTAEELNSAKLAFEATVPAGRLGKEITVVTKADQGIWNTLNGRLDPMTMEVANISMQHSGSSAGAIVKANTDIMGEIAGGYQHYIGSHMRQIAELSMHDIMDGLTRMSQYNLRMIEGQTLSPVAKVLSQPKDTANVIKNTILGNSNLNEYSSWRQVNQSFETGLSATMTKVGQIFNEAVRPLLPSFRSAKREIEAGDLARMDYETLSKKMEAVGAVNPWANFDDEAAKIFGLAKLTDSKDTSKRVIYASNALAATIALRVGELAQPIVNAMSLPILTGLAAAHDMPATFMGIARGSAKVGGVQVMYEGARAMHDPGFDKLRKLWGELGYFDPHISEANNTLKLARSFDRGAITQVEKALDSNLVRILSKPADWSESLVRAQTMHTGAVLAKRLYPELDDTGITIFARDFMDRAVGNYHSAQRPVFFQGTMGVAMGLFQTYMLTLGQSVYRHLEMKNYKALGTAALTQVGIFGGASMPGFNQISEGIGTHFSDNNIDLTTGTYRAIGDKAADALLYGLPSSMGPAFYTRGEVAPRVPNPLVGGLQSMVGVNFVMQTADMVSHVADSLKADNPNMARTLGEALSMQSMSRPLARMSEVATGYSVTRKGNSVSVPEDVWTPVGVMSRILSTRPLEEAKVRQAMHLNTLYGAADHDGRQQVEIKLKTAIRSDSLTDAKISSMAEEYMRKGGTAQGWRSAVNTALGQTNMTGRESLAHKLKPDSPLNHMLNGMD